MKKNNSKSKKKKSISTGLLKTGAVVIALAMTLGAGLLKLSDTNNDEVLDAVNPTYVIEEPLDLPPEPVADIQVPEKKEREKQGLPVGGVFLYIGGWLISAFAWLLGKIMRPLAARTIGWIIFAAAVIGTIAFILKKAFPDLKLKDLIPTKTAVFAGLSIAAVIAVGELIIHLYGSDCSFIVQCFSLAAGLVIILLVFNVCSNIAMKFPLKEA